jgi:hypothetical protein
MWHESGMNGTAGQMGLLISLQKQAPTCTFMEQPQRDSNPCRHLERVAQGPPEMLSNAKNRLDNGMLRQCARPLSTSAGDSVPQDVPQDSRPRPGRCGDPGTPTWTFSFGKSLTPRPRTRRGRSRSFHRGHCCGTRVVLGETGGCRLFHPRGRLRPPGSPFHYSPGR